MSKINISWQTKLAIASSITGIGFCALQGFPLLAGLIVFAPVWILGYLFEWMLVHG